MSRKGFPAHFGSILTVRIRSIPSQKLNGDFFKEQALQSYLVVHQTITPLPPLGLAHPQGVKATGQEGRSRPLPWDHSLTVICALLSCHCVPSIFISGLAICTQEALKNPGRVFHISQMPPHLDLGTPEWCYLVISGSPSYCNL